MREDYETNDEAGAAAFECDRAESAGEGYDPADGYDGPRPARRVRDLPGLEGLREYGRRMREEPPSAEMQAFLDRSP